jgi:hypothetical protein
MYARRLVGTDIVQWKVTMDNHARAGLVKFLEESLKLGDLKKKRAAANLFPKDSGSSPPQRATLVAIQLRQAINKPPARIYYMPGG